MSTDKALFDRIPIILQCPESPKFTETYGFAGTQGCASCDVKGLCAADTHKGQRQNGVSYSTLTCYPLPQM